MGTFVIKDDGFLLNNEKFQLIGGAIHYFRVPRAYWRDRLEKLVMMGCNTVETIVPWHLHEPRPGEFRFEGDFDIEAYIRLAQELGLWVLLRPSPYICGEFEFGGFPWWLLRDRAMRVRSSYPGFTDAVASYYDELIPRLASLQITQGGPVLAMQVENEYGSYGMEKPYTEFLRDAMRARGVDVLLFTSDGPWSRLFDCGKVEGVFQTGNFGSNVEKHFARIAEQQPSQPLVCMEYWMGWFDHWGGGHHRRDAKESSQVLDELLQRGHVNMYVFHGGTNFGFNSGANQTATEYKPQVTSYDYDAPLSEDGSFTEKFDAFREVISKYRKIPALKPSTVIEKAAPCELALQGRAELLPNLEYLCSPVLSQYPLSMEDLNQGFGYVNYRVNVVRAGRNNSLLLVGCADRTLVYLNGEFVAVRDHSDMDKPIDMELEEGDCQLDILVENQGRTNFTYKILDQRKGIDTAIVVDGYSVHTPVLHFSLPFDRAVNLPWKSGGGVKGPALHRFALEYNAKPGTYIDHFLDMSGWGKGIVLVNGFNLGRFWDIGPQKTLYLPGCVLHQGKNEIIVFESEGCYRDELSVRGQADLGEVEWEKV